MSTRSDRQLSPQPRLNSAHPTSESADPRSRRGNPERGQSRPKSQASAYLPNHSPKRALHAPAPPRAPPRRVADHKHTPHLSAAGAARPCRVRSRWFRAKVGTRAAPPCEPPHSPVRWQETQDRPRALGAHRCTAPVNRTDVSKIQVRRVTGNGSEPPLADSRTRPGRLRRRQTAGRQPGRRRREEREMWARVTWRRRLGCIGL